MELSRIDISQQLWRMLRSILGEGGFLQSKSSIIKAADKFEDELYNPPKSEVEIPKTRTNTTNGKIKPCINIECVMYMDRLEMLNCAYHWNGLIPACKCYRA